MRVALGVPRWRAWVCAGAWHAGRRWRVASGCVRVLVCGVVVVSSSSLARVRMVACYGVARGRWGRDALVSGEPSPHT